MIAIPSGDSRPCHSRDSRFSQFSDSRSKELQQEGQEFRRNEIDLAGWNKVAVVRVGNQPVIVAAGSLDSAGAKE